MALETAAYSAAVVFVAYLVRGIAGFGSGLIAVPLLTLISPITAVVPVVVSLDYIGSASQSVRNLDDIAWREQVVLLPFMLIGILAGLYLFTVMPTWVLAKTLGVLVIALGIYQLLPPSFRPARGSRIAATYCGFLGGLLGTLFGTGGPFYAIYLNARGLDRTTFRATFALNFLIDGGVRLIAYAVLGLLTRETLLHIAAALPIAAAGALCRRADPEPPEPAQLRPDHRDAGARRRHRPAPPVLIGRLGSRPGRRPAARERGRMPGPASRGGTGRMLGHHAEDVVTEVTRA